MQSWLPGFHAFRFLNLPHMQFVQEWVSVRFGFLSLHQHLNGHIDFQERAGGWHSPPAQVPDAAFRESGGPFPRGWPWPICFAFSLHLFFFLFTSIFPISFKNIQFWWSLIFDRGPSLSAGHLSTWQAWASKLRVLLRLHGFFSDLPFQVECFLCLLRRFYYLVQVNLLFPCVLHLALSLFPGCISSVYILHISCRLLPICIGSCHVFLICKMCPFQVAFALSIFPPFLIFASFQLAFCFPVVSAIVMCASLRFAFSNSIFCIVSPFVQDVNILEQALFDSTNLVQHDDIPCWIIRIHWRGNKCCYHMLPYGHLPMIARILTIIPVTSRCEVITVHAHSCSSQIMRRWATIVPHFIVVVLASKKWSINSRTMEICFRIFSQDADNFIRSMVI